MWGYSLETDEWEERFTIGDPVEIDIEKAALLSIGGDRLFTCSHSIAYIFDATGARRLPQMSTFRISPGLFYYIPTQSIYVFGGGSQSLGTNDAVNDVLSSSEVFTCPTSLWSLLPDMIAARHSFAPCEYQLAVYLVGGCWTTTVEVFDLKRQSFTLLPELTVPEGHSTLTLMCNVGMMVVVSGHFFSRWDLKTKTVMSQNRKEYSETTHCSMPAARRDTFYYVQGKACVRLNLQTFQVDYDLVGSNRRKMH